MSTALYAEIRITGLTDLDGKGPRFTLEDSANGETASFLALGSEFSGYTLDSYDAKAGTLTLRKGAETLVVGVADTHIKEMPPPSADTPEAPHGPEDAAPPVPPTDDELAARGLRRTRPGDTLSRIASQSGTTVTAILELNPGLDPRKLRVGQIIRVRKE